MNPNGPDDHEGWVIDAILLGIAVFCVLILIALIVTPFLP